MVEVYFIRHTESDYNVHDDVQRPLTSKGMKDRLLVTQYLELQGIDAAFSCPYRRVVDTIKDFTDKNNLEIKVVDGFRERKVGSIWIGDFHSFARKQWQDFSYKLLGGECLKEVQDRNINALNNILAKYRYNKIVIGSHGTSLSTIINYYDPSFELEQFEAIKELMPWVVKFTFDNRYCISIEKIDITHNKLAV